MSLFNKKSWKSMKRESLRHYFKKYVTSQIINKTFIAFVISVTLAATSGNFRGFLCQARTNVTSYSSTVGTLAQTGSVTMKQNCGTVSETSINSLYTDGLLHCYILDESICYNLGRILLGVPGVFSFYF